MGKYLLLLILTLTSFFCLAQGNTFPSTGFVGIGTTTPGAKLSFNNVSDGSDGPDGITWYSPLPLAYGIFRSPGSWNGPDYQQLNLVFQTGISLDPGYLHGKSYVDIKGGGLRVTSGNVGIGTTDTRGYKLAVNGNIISESVTVKLQSAWPDYVFSQDYPGISLPKLEEYIKTNHHLPDVPTATEVKLNGIDLGTLGATLLQKIEELTLQMIEMNKENQKLGKEIELLKQNKR